MSVRGIRWWKQVARISLSGRMGLPIAAVLIVNVLQLFGSSLASSFFPGRDLLSRVLGELFVIIVTVIGCILTAGMYRMFLHLCRDQAYSLGDLWYYFRNQPDRIIAPSLILAVIAWLTGLPATIYDYTILSKMDVSGLLSVDISSLTRDQNQILIENLMKYYRVLLIYLLLTLGGMLLNIIVTVPLTLTYYLLCDEEELDGKFAMVKSVQMMKGHCGQYILLQLSFFPWILLSVFLMYLPLLWVLPYMEMAGITFYRNLRGEIC